MKHRHGTWLPSNSVTSDMRVLALALIALCGFAVAMWQLADRPVGALQTSNPRPSSTAQPANADVEREVQAFHEWLRVNPRPQMLSYWVDQLCVGSTPEQAKRADSNPHKMKTVTVWVNPTGEKAMMKGGTFPVGSVIVKEKREGESGPVELSTVMLKRAKGFNPKCGDWEFAVLDAKGSKVTDRGKLATCMSCHTEQAAQDYVFKGYVPEE